MHMQNIKADAIELRINDTITISTVQKHKNLFYELINSTSELTIYIEDVTRIDSAGIQLLNLIKLESIRYKIKLNITPNSRLLIELLPYLCRIKP